MRLNTSWLAGALSVLAGCVAPSVDLPGGVTPAATSLAMFNGNTRAVGPTGFCADPDSSRPKSGFAIFAPCSTLKVEGALATAPAITTIQFGPEQSAVVQADAAGFADFLKGPGGPFMLSRSGDSETVRVIEVRKFQNFVAVYLRDKAPAHIDGAQEAEWRAFVDIAGRLTTVSVRGLDVAPLGDQQGAALLDQAVQALIAANSPTGA